MSEAAGSQADLGSLHTSATVVSESLSLLVIYVIFKLQANHLGSCTVCCNPSGQRTLLRVTDGGKQIIKLAAAYRLGDVTRCVWGQHIFDLARHCHCGFTVNLYIA